MQFFSPFYYTTSLLVLGGLDVAASLLALPRLFKDIITTLRFT